MLFRNPAEPSARAKRAGELAFNAAQDRIDWLDGRIREIAAGLAREAEALKFGGDLCGSDLSMATRIEDALRECFIWPNPDAEAFRAIIDERDADADRDND